MEDDIKNHPELPQEKEFPHIIRARRRKLGMKSPNSDGSMNAVVECIAGCGTILTAAPGQIVHAKCKKCRREKRDTL